MADPQRKQSNNAQASYYNGGVQGAPQTNPRYPDVSREFNTTKSIAAHTLQKRLQLKYGRDKKKREEEREQQEKGAQKRAPRNYYREQVEKTRFESRNTGGDERFSRDQTLLPTDENGPIPQKSNGGVRRKTETHVSATPTQGSMDHVRSIQPSKNRTQETDTGIEKYRKSHPRPTNRRPEMGTTRAQENQQTDSPESQYQKDRAERDRARSLARQQFRNTLQEDQSFGQTGTSPTGSRFSRKFYSGEKSSVPESDTKIPYTPKSREGASEEPEARGRITDEFIDEKSLPARTRNELFGDSKRVPNRREGRQNAKPQRRRRRGIRRNRANPIEEVEGGVLNAIPIVRTAKIARSIPKVVRFAAESPLAKWVYIGSAATISMWIFLFALFSSVSFAIAAYLDYYEASTITGTIFGFFIDFNEYIPAGPFGMATWGLAALIAIIAFFIFYIRYWLAGKNPFGNVQHFLVTTTCIAMSVLPITNIFPWFFVWVMYMNVVAKIDRE